MAVLGLIPARGGSKGIPRKNVRSIAGKPLIAWTIEAALAASDLDAVVVTTDDPEIAEVARTHGASVPFMRPAALAADDTPGIDPVLHALEMLPGFDRLVLLQPTSPLRVTADISEAIALSADHGDCNVVGVSEARHSAWTFPAASDGTLDLGVLDQAVRRQDLPVRYALNGAIYVTPVDRLRERRSFLVPGTRPYIMPPERSVDIDDPLDWKLAAFLLADRERAEGQD